MLIWVRNAKIGTMIGFLQEKLMLMTWEFHLLSLNLELVLGQMFALEKLLKLLMNAIKFSQVGPTGNSKFTKTSLRLLEQDLKASTTKMVLFKIKK